MSKKTIVLADNSYTIRRIVELSFSEEMEIQLVSFENSLNLREKLLELRPHVVLVDIKLPEFNGYEVCRFVQESERLQHTRVFLLKGGFEPIDEALLNNLKFVDIITKPFDSNALVNTIKNLITQIPEPLPQAPGAAPAPPRPVPPPPPPPMMEMPSSLPEDLPEIDTIHEPEREISFSDIKSEIDSDGIMGDDDFTGAGSFSYGDDDILPSEEITQGSQPERDFLAPSQGEDLDNPFQDEISAEDASLTEEELNIRRNIALQEQELEIGSLTLEEINITKHIRAQQMKPSPPEDSDTADMFAPSGLDHGVGLPEEGSGLPVEPPASFMSESKRIPKPPDPIFGEPESESEFEVPYSSSSAVDEQLFADEPELPEVNYETHDDDGLESPSFGLGDMPSFDAPEVSMGFEETPDDELEMASPETFTTRKMDLGELGADVDVNEYIVPQPEPQSFMPQTPAPPEAELDFSSLESPQMDNLRGVDAMTSPEPMTDTEDVLLSTPAPAPEPEPERSYDTIPQPQQQPDPFFASIPEPPTPFQSEPEPDFAPEPPRAYIPEPDPAFAPTEYKPEPEPKLEPKLESAQAPAPTPIIVPTDVLLNRMEAKLAQAVKEMLWEILPPLAEKIIKEEVEALKADAKNH